MSEVRKNTIRGNSQDLSIVSEERDSPNGGLRAIRLKNGWDDSLPPVLGPDYAPRERTKRTTSEIKRTYEDSIKP